MAFGNEEEAFDPNGPADDGNPFGMSEAELTHEVDVSDYVVAKRNAIASHRSQVTDTAFFLSMPEEMFASGVQQGVVHRARSRARDASRMAVRRMTASTGCTWSVTAGPLPVGTAIAIPTSTTSGAPRR